MELFGLKSDTKVPTCGLILFLINVNDMQKCTPVSEWLKENKFYVNGKETKYILSGPNSGHTIRQRRDLDILIYGKSGYGYYISRYCKLK